MQTQKNATKIFRLRITAPKAKSYHKEYNYDILTPHAICRALDNAYWKPGMHWVVDKIYLNAPIKKEYRDGEEILVDVDYIIDAHIAVDIAHKRESRRYYEQAFRNISNRSYFKPPYFGNPAWHATIDIYDKFYIMPTYRNEDIDLGQIFYGFLNFGERGQTEIYFRCVIDSGVIDLRKCQKFKRK